MKAHKSLLIPCAALLIALGAAPAQAAEIAVSLGNLSVDIDFGPPPARVEPVPAPRHDHVWAPGYWRAEGRHYEWVAGRWLEARHGHAWVADRWIPVGQRWRHEPGHWERHDIGHQAQNHHEPGSWREREGEHHSRYQ